MMTVFDRIIFGTTSFKWKLARSFDQSCSCFLNFGKTAMQVEAHSLRTIDVCKPTSPDPFNVPPSAAGQLVDNGLTQSIKKPILDDESQPKLCEVLLRAPSHVAYEHLIERCLSNPSHSCPSAASYSHAHHLTKEHISPALRN